MRVHALLVASVVSTPRPAWTQAATDTLPTNVAYPALYEPVLQSMATRSRTFRRQINRLAHAASVHVVLETARHLPPREARARTRITQAHAGRVDVVVELPPWGDLPELIAHEIEHILEFLDGVDLRRLASQAGTGVEAIGGRFETIRATRVGVIVAQEMARSGV